MPAPPLLVQTTYAELSERCSAAAFSLAFPEKGTFVSKMVKGRRYWYFQVPAELGRAQKYVGPETPELLEKIARHREAHHDERERSTLVSALVRLGMPRPNAELSDVVAALAGAGVFRLRSVLVGTMAYQTYPAMLGTRLPAQSIQTDDVDIAQFASASKAIEDRTIPVFDILRSVDKTFSEVPGLTRDRKATSYRTRRRGLRVDFLTPNEGPETDEPQFLPALGTFAQPLRFLDFLLHDPVPGIVLHGAGIYVTVPAPERYAVHKLIIAQRRAGAAVKREKDIVQAGALLSLLSQKRPFELRSAWEEAEARGKSWREAIVAGLTQLPQIVRDPTLKGLRRTRESVPGIDLTFQNPAPHYIFDRDVVAFNGEAIGESVQCMISREALEDHFNAEGLSQKQRLECFLKNRGLIEQLARTKYLKWPIEEPGAVLIKTLDVTKLLEKSSTSGRRRGRVTPV